MIKMSQEDPNKIPVTDLLKDIEKSDTDKTPVSGMLEDIAESEPSVSSTDRIRGKLDYILDYIIGVSAASIATIALAGLGTLLAVGGLTFIYQNQDELKARINEYTSPPVVVETQDFVEAPIPTQYPTMMPTTIQTTISTETAIPPTQIPQPTPTIDNVVVSSEPKIYQAPTTIVLPWKIDKVIQSSAYEQPLKAGDVLYLSASHFNVGSVSCDNNNRDDFLCVYLHEAANDETVRIENLIPGHAWIGVTDQFGIEAALQNRSQYWWNPPNCVNGCYEVKVVKRHADGHIENEYYTR